jgi:hypothetical protein
MTKQLVIALEDKEYCDKGKKYYIETIPNLNLIYMFSLYDLNGNLLKIVSNNVDIKQGKLPSEFILLSDYREQLLTEIIEEE